MIRVYQQWKLKDLRKSKELEKSAKEDGLTGLYNYSYFSKLAQERIQSLEDHFEDNVFLFLDVHNFKAFNDQRGFEEGDKFLTAFGKYLSDIFKNALYARQADDHFVVFTETADLKEKLNTLNNLVHGYDDEILMGINCGAYHISSNKEDPRMAIDRARYAAHLIKNRFQTIYSEYDKTVIERFQGFSSSFSEIRSPKG